MHGRTVLTTISDQNPRCRAEGEVKLTAKLQQSSQRTPTQHQRSTNATAAQHQRNTNATPTQDQRKTNARPTQDQRNTHGCEHTPVDGNPLFQYGKWLASLVIHKENTCRLLLDHHTCFHSETEGFAQRHQHPPPIQLEFLYESYGSVSLFCWSYHGFAQEELMYTPSSCRQFPT